MRPEIAFHKVFARPMELLSRSRTVVLHGAGVTAVATVGAVSSSHPFVALALAVGVLFMIALRLNPYGVAVSLAFLMTAFPKAGFKVADFPFPIFLFGAVFTLLLLRLCAEGISGHGLAPRLALISLMGWVMYRAATLAPTAHLGGTLAYGAWALVPAAMLYFGTQLTLPDVRIRTALERGFMVASLFGLVQFVAGVERTDVPGLTIAWGDSYADKNNTIRLAGLEEFSKIVSTYQNGNIFGVTATFFLIVASARIIKRRAGSHEYILLAASAMSIWLSGSRTAVVCTLVGMLWLLVVSSGSAARKLVIIGAATMTYVAVLWLQPGLAQRYSLENVLATGGAGREELWSTAFRQATIGDWVFGSPQVWPVEGGVGLVLAHGLVGVILLVWLVLSCLRKRPDWRYPFAIVALAACVDSSYALFPTWFIPALAASCSAVAPRVDSADGRSLAGRGSPGHSAPSPHAPSM